MPTLPRFLGAQQQHQRKAHRTPGGPASLQAPQPGLSVSTGGGVAPAQSRRASPGSSASGPGPELLPGRQLDSILLRERVASAHKRPRHRKRPALTALAPRKYAFFHDRAITIHPLNRPHGPAPPIPPSAQGERGIQKAEQRGDGSRGRDRAPPHCVRSRCGSPGRAGTLPPLIPSDQATLNAAGRGA